METTNTSLRCGFRDNHRRFLSLILHAPTPATETVSEPPGAKMSAVIVIVAPVTVTGLVVTVPAEPPTPAKPSARNVASPKLEFRAPE
jgi:hypothetical protein